MRLRFVLTALVCAALTAAAAGCGESDEEQARETVEDYIAAREAGDEQAICDMLSVDLKAQLGLGDTCSGQAAELGAGGEALTLEIIDVRVRDEQAAADLNVSRNGQPPSRIQLRLVDEDGEWRIAALQ